jgi:N-acyl-D-amino-acid deacylase
MPFDVVIRGGTLVDGTGALGRRADVAVSEGVVAEIGELDDPAAATEVDAAGCVVTPGFVDPHTHLDAQLCWDPTASPTCLHGVTSVVLGLCGFGVAPCPDGGGEYLLRSLEMVEEIPFDSTSLGVPFTWSTWPEFLAHLGTLSLGVNVAGLVPHSALRYFVMGERARSETATAGDRARLRHVAGSEPQRRLRRAGAEPARRRRRAAGAGGGVPGPAVADQRADEVQR